MLRGGIGNTEELAREWSAESAMPPVGVNVVVERYIDRLLSGSQSG